MGEATIQLKEIKCSNCGGEVQFDPSTQLTVCNFCGSTFDIKQAKNVDVIEPDGIIPFKVTRELFNNSVLDWLSQGDFTPDDVLTGSVLKNISGIYLPFYSFDGSYAADWSASSGYYRKETYTEYVTKYENNRSHQVPVTKTRTVTDWRPSSGKVNGAFSELGIASAALPNEYASFCEDATWERGSVKDFDIRVTTGFVMEAFSVSPDSSYDSRVQKKVSAIVDAHIAKVVPGDTKKDIQWTGSVNKVATNVYLPFWLAAYAYNGKKYSCALDGQNCGRITGVKPIDEDRVKTIKSYFLPFYLTIALYVIIAGLFFLSDGLREGAYRVLIGGLFPVAMAGIIATYRKNKLLTKSKRLRADILQKVKGSQCGLPEDLTDTINT